MTYKLSQDHLEIFFSAIRSRGGFNNNPTAWEFKVALKRLMAKADIRILHNANCHILDDTKLVMNDNVLEERSEEFIDKNNLLFFEEHDYSIVNLQSNLSEYAYEVIMYIAGFVSKSVAKYLQCENCKKYLTDTKVLSKLQSLKCRGGLTNASPDVIEICVTTEKILKTNPNELTKKMQSLYYV